MNDKYATCAARSVAVHLVEDDEAMRQSVSRWLALAGFQVETQPRADPLLQQVTPAFPGVIVSDVRMPRLSGLEFQEMIYRVDPDLPVILITGHGDIDMAVNAMRAGAYDFIEKPFDAERLLDAVHRACEKRLLVLENRRLRAQMQEMDGLHARLVGSSEPMRRLKRQIMEVGPVDANVLLIGETGTGKEVVARCLHDLSSRRNGPYVPLNCGAIPASLAESELFGHEAGAFTSASRRRIGSLEQAGGGTLFLDEVMAMPLDVQAKLLRAIQEREFSRLGSSGVLQSDFRLVAAANREPRQAIDMGLVREDLYYRFNTVEIRLPPLRERKEDIPMLFVLFTEQAAEAYQREMVYPDADTMAMLLAHDWPGNIRELKNVATRFVLSTLHPQERLISLLGQGRHESAGAFTLSGEGVGLQEQVRIFERSLLQDALRRHGGQVQPVLNELKLARRTFNEKLNRYGLHRESVDAAKTFGENPPTI